MNCATTSVQIRRRGTVVALAPAVIGLLVLAARNSGPQMTSASLLVVGTMVFLAPFALVVHRVIGSCPRLVLAAMVIGISTGLLLATRRTTGYVQVWIVFALFASTVPLLLANDVMRSTRANH